VGGDGRLVALVVLISVLLGACGSTKSSSSTVASTAPRLPAVPTAVGPWDWPTYGQNAHHTFSAQTTLTESSAKTLKKAWIYPTGDSVTATPTVVGDTVYVGSWDDYFYAVNLETGQLRWKTLVKAQHGVVPYPGQKGRPSDSDGGLITSSAWFEPAGDGRPALVIFGGGYTLYALDAATGSIYWEHDYPGRLPEDPDTDNTRIFSSPVVTDGLVLFGVDVDGQKGSAGYVVGASLTTGEPVWEFQTDVAAPGGPVLNDGCGSVWSSGTVLPALGLVVFDTADCAFTPNGPYSDAIEALHITTGQLAWVYKPTLVDLECDFDFGATPNAGVNTQGQATFLGVGGKDGTYYSLEPATGALRWSTNVVFGGFSGGFIATTAYDGTGVFGATAIGDFGRFESHNGDKSYLCDPSNPRDTAAQNPSDHAFDAATGAIRWQADAAASFSPTTVAGGMAFNGLALVATAVQVRDVKTGHLVTQIGLPQANWSGIAVVGDALVLGLGSTYSPKAAGIEVLTPGGKTPVVPG